MKQSLFTILVFGLLTACASMSAREKTPQIQISGTVVGADLELTPSLLRIEPGQKVVWTNHTTYDIQINFDPESVKDLPSFIPAFSTARVRFDEAGTYSYTLIYSSAATFGRVTGTIVVGNPRPKEEPSQEEAPRKQPERESPPEKIPDTFDDII